METKDSTKIIYGFVCSEEEKEGAFSLVNTFDSFDFNYIIIENEENSIDDSEEDVILCNKKNLEKVLKKNALIYDYIFLNFFDIKICEEVKDYIIDISIKYNVNLVIVNLDKDISYSFMNLDLAYIRKETKEKLKEYESKLKTKIMIADFLKITEEENDDSNTEYSFSIKKDEKIFIVNFKEKSGLVEVKLSKGKKVSLTLREADFVCKILDFLTNEE